MPEDVKRALAEAVRRIPEATFIWKYEEPKDVFASSVKEVENLVITKWMPQNDLLSGSHVM